MGGFGSGRRPSDSRKALDDMPALDVRRLHREGHLEPGFRGVVPLACAGREVGAVALRRDGDTLTIAYNVTVAPGVGGETIEERVPLPATPQPGGGERLWFACPGCGRRCAVLYRVERFRCARCVGGAYTSQTETERNLLLRRARAIKVKLGGQDSLLVPFPSKPKRMRWTTYWRLFKEDQECIAAAFELTRREMAKLRKALSSAEPERGTCR